MKLGEKLQRLRKQNGLSQEQLAARLAVSRQAVSKWELDETMPDTENVIQLSRLFGVSCDYLLRDEVDEPGAAKPTPPGETHLTRRGWIRSALVLSLTVCAVGLLLGVGVWLNEPPGNRTPTPLFIGLIVQMLGIVLFELAVPRMGEGRYAARVIFYVTACWFVPPLLLLLAGTDPMSCVYYSLFLAVPVTVIALLVCFFLSEKK